MQFIKLQADDPQGPSFWLNLDYIQQVTLWSERELTVTMSDRSTMAFKPDSPGARMLLDAIENPPSNMKARKAVEALALRGLNSFVAGAIAETETEDDDDELEEDDDFWTP